MTEKYIRDRERKEEEGTEEEGRGVMTTKEWEGDWWMV